MHRLCKQSPGRAPQASAGPQNQGAQRILATVDSIPRGRVATYGQVAAEAGLEGRARLVGRLLRQLPAASHLPWHRVLAAGGRIALGKDSRAGRRQIAKLKAEGVPFSAAMRVDLKRCAWCSED